MPPPAPPSSPHQPKLATPLLAMLGLLLLSGESDLWGKVLGAWGEPAYWGAWLAIPLSLAVLWRRWPAAFHASRLQRWAAVALFALALAARMAAWWTAVAWLEGLAVTGCLAVLLYWAGGTILLRAGLAPLVILLLMVPLPWAWQNQLLDPPQDVVTNLTRFMLQTIGVDAYLEGVVINVGQNPHGLIDPSSRLPLIMAVLALAMTIAFFRPAAWWERCLIVASAIPVLIAAHTVRLGLAAVVHWQGNVAWVERLSSSGHGWAVLSVVALALVVEFALLRRLVSPSGPLKASPFPPHRRISRDA